MRKVINVKKNLVPAVCNAVRGLHETRGSSLQSIATFIQATVKPGAVAPTLQDVKAALKVAEANQKLFITNGRFLLPSSLALSKRKVSRGTKACVTKKKSKSHKRKASPRRKSSHKKRKSLCKPRCQRKKPSRRQRRKCVRPCTRMWKPKKSTKESTKKGRKCAASEDNFKQDESCIEPPQIKFENPE